jgi:hypothetical protein
MRFWCTEAGPEMPRIVHITRCCSLPGRSRAGRADILNQRLCGQQKEAPQQVQLQLAAAASQSNIFQAGIKATPTEMATGDHNPHSETTCRTGQQF